MTKTIKAAKSLASALADFESAIAAESTTLPEKPAAALEKLRKSANSAATLLLDLSSAEFNRAVADAKAKLKA